MRWPIGSRGTGAHWTRAIEKGYIIAHGQDSLAHRNWHGRCQEERRPSVIVFKPGTLARVTLDMTPAHQRLSEAGMNRIAEAADAGGVKVKIAVGGLETISVSLQRAEDFATAVLEVLRDPASTERRLEAGSAQAVGHDAGRSAAPRQRVAQPLLVDHVGDLPTQRRPGAEPPARAAKAATRDTNGPTNRPRTP